MSIRRFNITYLLENGKRIVPLGLIIDYRFIRLDIDVKVSIWATMNNKSYKCLGVQTLFKPNDEREPVGYTLDFNTDIFALKTVEATGLFVHIENAEFIELKRLSMTYNTASRISGRVTGTEVWYPPYPETDWHLSPYIPSRMYDDALRVTPYMVSIYDSSSVLPYMISTKTDRAVTPYMISTYLGINVGAYIPSTYEADAVIPYQMSSYVELSVMPYEISTNNDPNLFFLGDLVTPPVVVTDNLFFLGELI